MNWIPLYDSPDFRKWGYKTSSGNIPYIVVVQRNDRGHFEALFTSVYGPPNVLLRGNCGGGEKGRTVATAAAWSFMKNDYPHGGPPPKELI